MGTVNPLPTRIAKTFALQNISLVSLDDVFGRASVLASRVGVRHHARRQNVGMTLGGDLWALEIGLLVRWRCDNLSD